MSELPAVVNATTSMPWSPPLLSKEVLERMSHAVAAVVDSIQGLHAVGQSLVTATLQGHEDFTEWEHYPSDDVYDPLSYAQYYFHAHPPEEREAPDFGHFHTFLRARPIFDDLHPDRMRSGAASPEQTESTLTHLVAISMSQQGMPERLFTTNRWVTGETWCRADDLIELLDHFRIDLDHPNRAVNNWLTSMFVLFRPQVEQLLIERDRLVLQWQAEHADVDAFEDRRLEIVSSIEISLEQQIEWLDRALSVT